MEPFAYKKAERPNRRKLILMALAGVSFSIWYFDFVPELGTVSTGSIEDNVTDPNFTPDDFIAMLESDSDSRASEIMDDSTFAAAMSAPDEDPIMASLEEPTEPIEAAFPEFANAAKGGSETRQNANLSAATPAFENAEAATSDPPSAIQQTAFAKTDAPSFDRVKKETVLPADVADHLNDIDAWMAADETLEAHAALSRLYWKKPEARVHIQTRLNTTAAQIYANPTKHFAEPYLVQFGDTLEGIAKDHNVPWQYLARLNRVTPKTLQAGRQLKVLKGPFSAVVDLDDMRLTLHAHGWYVRSYQVGIGKDQSTPTGEFSVKEKLENPTWYNPDGGIVDGDDPTNPLGEYWIGLGDHIGLHGTIDPDSIGASVSRGCIHLADDDIAEVFQLLGEGSTVTIRHSVSH